MAFWQSALKLLPTITGIGSGAIQSHLDRKQSVENQQRTIQANKELAEYAYSKDLEMWERQNLYNSPQAQMERLGQAGINPVLAFGKDIGGNTSGQMPKYQAPRVDYGAKPFNMLGILSAFQDFTMKNAQIDLVNEQTRVANETANLRDIEGRSANRYFQNRSWYMHDKRAREAERMLTETSPVHLLHDDSYYSAMAREQLQAQQLRNDMMRKDLEYYLWNNVGSKIGSIVGSLSRAFRVGKIGLGGMPKIPKSMRYR